MEEGRPYIVGERGPELFVPGTYGSIVPNSQLGATTVSVGNITIQVTGTGDPEAVANAVFAKFEQQTNALAKRQGRRGQVWQ